MVYCAEFGNPKSFYGNIQLGEFTPFQQIWGAWQRRKRVHEDLPQHQGHEPEPHIVTELPGRQEQLVEVPNVSANLETIRRLKAELANREDTAGRQIIRQSLENARAEKENAFKLRAKFAREDDEEAAFILFN